MDVNKLLMKGDAKKNMLNQLVKPLMRKYSLIVSKKVAEFNFAKNICEEDGFQTDMSWASNVDELLEHLELGYQELTIIFSDNLPIDVANGLSALHEGLINLPGLSIVEIGEDKCFSDCKSYINIEAIYDLEEDEEEMARIQAEKEKEMYLQKHPAKGNKTFTLPSPLPDIPRETTSQEIMQGTLDEPVEPFTPIIEGVPTEKYTELMALNEETLETLVNVSTLLEETTEEKENLIKDKEKHKKAISELKHQLSLAKDETNVKVTIIEETQKKLMSTKNLLHNALSDYEKVQKELLAAEEKYKSELDILSKKKSKLEEMVKSHTLEQEQLLESNSEEENTLRKLIKTMEQEISKLKEEIVSLKLDNQAKFENAKAKNKEIHGLKEEIEGLNSHISELAKTIDTLGESQVNRTTLENLKTVLNDKEIETVNLSEQIRLLKVENKKIEDNLLITEDELAQMRSEYKELASKGVENKKVEYVEHELNGETNPTVFYFKIFSQPPYMRSILTALAGLLTKQGKVLTIIMQEENALSDKYYPGIPRYPNLDAVKEDDTVILLTPSKFMVTENEDFYSQYENIIVLDYISSTRSYLKGGTVIYIPTFISEYEKELHNVRSLSLHGGPSSIIDMRYDSKITFVSTTPLIKKMWLDKKVTTWLSSIGFNIQ